MAMLTLLALSLLGGAPEAPKGRLVIIGGGPAADAIRRQTLELAGGTGARVVVIPHASGVRNAGEWSRLKWVEEGAQHVTILDLEDPAKAVAEIRAADLIFFRGGSQTRLMNALAGTGVPEAILARFREGAVISGTSAGAAVMSQVMIAGNMRRGDPTPRIAAGLGLWPEVIVDQHFLRRNREGRLRSAVLTQPTLIGVGIDEETAVLVSGRSFEVLGTSSVVVLDARKTAVAAAGGGTVPLDVVMSELKAGMKFDLDKGILGN